MTLTISNPDYADAIMEYLYTHYDVKGDENHLADELLTDLITQPDIWAIESALEEIFNEPVTLPKDLKIIQK